MKKLILISLVIFFAICSKSWAEELDGTNLECIGEKFPMYIQFKDNKTVISPFLNPSWFYFPNISSPINTDIWGYWTDNNYVYITSGLMRSNIEIIGRINRKTLEYYSYGYYDKKYKKMSLCKVVDLKYINNALNNERERRIKERNKKLKELENKNKKEREGNKI